MSEFQDLALPAIRDAQDYPRLVPAGQTVEIPVVGEFVYCKFSDGDVKVTINGKTTRMESGDERRTGDGTVFRGVNLTNDTAFDKSVIFVIGFGKFDRKIIQGEISVVPGIKDASGNFIDDSRYDLDAEVDISDLQSETFVKDTLISQPDAPITSNIVNAAYIPQTGYILAQMQGGGRQFLINIEDDTDFVEVSDKAIFADDENIYPWVATGARGCIGPDGYLWLGVESTTPGDNTCAIAKVDQTLNIIQTIVAPVDIDTDSSAFIHPILGEGRIFAAIQVGSNAIDVYEYVNDEWIYRFSETRALSWSIQDNAIVASATSGTTPRAAYELSDFSERVDLSGLVNLKYGGLFIPERRYILVPASQNVNVYVSDSWTKYAEGSFETCAGGYAFQVANAPTEAEVTASEFEGGAIVSGELLKMILEFWLGDFVADDYLNHIYKVEFANANGRAPFIVSSGGESFAAAGVKDNFSAEFPQNVKITLTRNLETKD